MQEILILSIRESAVKNCTTAEKNGQVITDKKLWSQLHVHKFIVRKDELCNPDPNQGGNA